MPDNTEVNEEGSKNSNHKMITHENETLGQKNKFKMTKIDDCWSLPVKKRIHPYDRNKVMKKLKLQHQDLEIEDASNNLTTLNVTEQEMTNINVMEQDNIMKS